MAELLESLCIICNPKCWECICNTNCIGKCVECPGQCITGSFRCFVDCIHGINCSFCSKMCCGCSPQSCDNIWASTLCKGIENDCLAMLNCNSFIGNFSLGLQVICNGYANRLCDAFFCWLFCCPADCLATMGYSRAGYINSRAERKKKKNPHHFGEHELPGTEQDFKNERFNRVEPEIYHQDI